MTKRYDGQSVTGPDGLLRFKPVAESRLDVVCDVYNAASWLTRIQPYADLKTIDISKWDDGAAEQARLAAQLYKAMTTDGFFVLTGHAITEQEIERQVDIGFVGHMKQRLREALIWPKTVLQKTPLQEKEALQGHMDRDGIYRGFKLRQYYE